jgi:hypothetical protein
MAVKQDRYRSGSAAQRRHATDFDRRAACRRIGRHWNDDVIAEARLLVMRCPWDSRHVDDNHLVANVKTTILAGGRNLEVFAETIIAVMAWTNGVLPDSWHHALTQLPGPAELYLRSIFDDFETPGRSLF